MFKKRKKPITEDKKTEQDALTIPPKDYNTTDFVASKPEPVNPNQFYTPAPTTEEQSLIPAVRPPAVQEPFYTPSATPEIVEQPLIPAVRPMTGQEPFYTPSTSPQPEEQTPQPATNLMAVKPPNAQERYDNAYNKRVDENGKFIDRDKGKGSALKNFFKGLGIGFLRGGLPGALASGVLNTAVGNLDEQWAWNNLHRPNLQGEVNREQQQQKERQQAEYEDARTQTELGKPIIAEQRQKLAEEKQKTAQQGLLMRQYNALAKYDENDPDDRAFGDAYQQAFGFRPPSKNADTKTEYFVDQSDGQMYLVQTDKQGNYEITRYTNEDGTPFRTTTPQMLSSQDRAKQRELQAAITNANNANKIKTATIMANAGITRTQMQQEGATNRTIITQQNQNMRNDANNQTRQYTQAQKAKRDAYNGAVKAAQQKWQRAKASKDQQGMDDAANELQQIEDKARKEGLLQ